MKSAEVRKAFLDFFQSKQHQLVSSAPMVVKDDPTLMFTNAGMNQFKDIFLGNSEPKSHRVANSQKCLRVSGKHNDLEEVGHDTYHHTMFEMLGNWSFGDYFKKEAIDWGWEFLTDVLEIPQENLYVTVFEGSQEDGLAMDNEAYQYWAKIIPEERILKGSKKDNFWEMGDTGPCGPCSEIHIDIRDAADKAKVDGKSLVNMDHPQVIEIWNLVFIEFNRLASGELQALPQKHVDTGMGFERLSMVMQGVQSNYDTDVFQPLLQEIAKMAGKKYGKSEEDDIAMRVIADHLRAVSFAIADGQLPSNTGAGYVIRRILRRAIRYGFTFLGFKEAFINELVPSLASQMGDYFPELKAQEQLITKVITEEENSFLRTLAQGIRKFDAFVGDNIGNTIPGKFAFELFDTYGFPIDLTQLMAREKGWNVDMDGYNKGLQEQKERSRKAGAKDAGDWVILLDGFNETVFTGYESLEGECNVVKYRKVAAKKSHYFEIVLDKTPFYAESGGQVGDTGSLQNDSGTIYITDTIKDNNLSIHIAKEIPENMEGVFHAKVNGQKRLLTANNHSATHLMHSALREVLGDHVEQKGSLVDDKHLRFDFSHFAKMTEEEIRKVEQIVNARIRENIAINEQRDVPFDDALQMGAVALFGEKYGDSVRVITFNKAFSVELCGGTHVPATGQIGVFKITSESAIAAGVRRIEAITAIKAEQFFIEQEDQINALKRILKNQKDIVKGVQGLVDQNQNLQKQLETLLREKTGMYKETIRNSAVQMNNIQFLSGKTDLDMNGNRDLAFQLNREVENMFLIIGSAFEGKAGLTIMISENLIQDYSLNAGQLIREFAKEIQGGGGGQAHFASAGGKLPSGIEKALNLAKSKIESITH